MPNATMTCGPMHYRRAGTGMPLVLLHANPGECRDFDAVFETLAAHYDVVAPDWPGFGASAPLADPSGASAMALYEVLVEFLDVLGIERAMFIGNSVGGYAATRLAIEHPERVAKLVLVSPGGFTAHNVFTRAFCRWQGSSYALPSALMARLYLRRCTPVADSMRARAAAEQSAAPTSLQVKAIWRSFISPEHDLRERARAIDCPVQLVYGSFDPVIPWWRDGREARRAMPHAQFIRLACGHVPFAEMPAEFLAASLPFLAA